MRQFFIHTLYIHQGGSSMLRYCHNIHVASIPKLLNFNPLAEKATLFVISCAIPTMNDFTNKFKYAYKDGYSQF